MFFAVFWTATNTDLNWSIMYQGVDMSDGTVYPLLKRLRDNGHVTTYLVESSEGPARKYYHLTQTGAEYAQELRRDWFAFIKNIEKIIGTEEVSA